MEKGDVDVVEVKQVEEGSSFPGKQRTNSTYSEPQSPLAGDISTSPTAIPLRSLQSHSTLHSDKDTAISEDTSKPILPSLNIDEADEDNDPK